MYVISSWPFESRNSLYILKICPIFVNLEWTLMLEEVSSLLIYIELAAKLVRSKKTQGPIHETVT